MTHQRKLLLIGWDAADWKVITPLLDEGKMPNLARLIDHGVMGNLATLYPVLSPMLWTSIATGKRAWKHGIHGFTEPDTQTGNIRPISNLSRKTKAVWNILNQNGLQSNVIGWWPSHPAEPIDGVMVSDMYCKAAGESESEWPMRPGTVHPPTLSEPLAKLRIHPFDLEGEQILPFVPLAEQIDQDQDKRLFAIGKVFAECSTVHAAATAVMQLEPWDFMAVYYDAIDHFSHGFMRYHPPRQDWIDERDFELYSEVVTSAYRFHDLMLGVLIKLAPEDTTFIVMSDHGFHSDHLRPQHLPNEPAGPADEHRHFGILVMSGPGIKKDELVFGASLLDIAPTILHLFGLPIGRDMDGKPLFGALEGDSHKAADDGAAYIDSWDEVAGDDGRHPADSQTDPVDAHEAIAQLVELGYIESPDADRETAVDNTLRELQYNLARAYIGGRRLPEAIEILEELWDRWPEEQRFGVQAFNAWLGMGRTEEARACLDRIVENKQKYASQAREEWIEFQKELQARVEAVDDSSTEGDAKDDPAAEETDRVRQPELTRQEQYRMRRLRARAQTNVHTIAYLNGVLLLAENRPDEALVELEKAREVETHQRPDVCDKMGQAYLKLRRWSDAQREYETMMELDPASAPARLGLAQSLLPRRRFRQALDQAMASVGLIYHQPLAHYLCGVALKRLGQWEEAAASFRTAVEQNPSFAQAHLQLARLYERALNDPQRGRQHRRLAGEARQRVADFRTGRVSIERPVLESVPGEIATLGDLGRSSDPGPRSREEIVIVSGLPRSGTSMMMQMLAAGGLPILTDRQREADESNPRGYLEFEPAKRLYRDADWLDQAEGKGVKIVAQLLPQLPLARRYRIIYMERPLDEVVASQAEMLSRQSKSNKRVSNPSRLARTFGQQIDQVRQRLAQRSEQVAVLPVNYHDAIADAEGVASRVNRFLGGGLDEAAMAAAVDWKLRRQRGGRVSNQ